MADHWFSSNMIEPSKEVTADVVSKVLGPEALEYDAEKTLSMMLSALSDAKAKISAQVDATQSARCARRAAEVAAETDAIDRMRADAAAAQNSADQRRDAALGLVAEVEEKNRMLNLAKARNERALRRRRALENKNLKLRRRRVLATFRAFVLCLIAAALAALALKASRQ
ncbi:hypothetical protein CYLTODRAFT_494960 [Cylindrobasidium torrendii FP15055 ss-10]|uniref:Uncharacterized protein n=1 Tax=Cylindrobasidium torrendii FP15055 ss-10 TaxID=1314674 RepID=A0A0D7AVR3_9AGAR|nr:hypothetical protein CYLTODRAFT_494960 [Cylindrobasidium torrendii FP15055 ss-10]